MLFPECQFNYSYFVLGRSDDKNNKISHADNFDQSTLPVATVQQMTHGFVHYFEKELDQVQSSLKEAL